MKKVIFKVISGLALAISGLLIWCFGYVAGEAEGELKHLRSSESDQK